MKKLFIRGANEECKECDGTGVYYYGKENDYPDYCSKCFPNGYERCEK